MIKNIQEALTYIQEHSADDYSRIYAKSLLRLTLIPEQKNCQLKYLAKRTTDPEIKKILIGFMV